MVTSTPVFHKTTKLESLTLRHILGIILKMGKRRTKLSDQVRQAVDESGQSRYAIGKATGIDAATLSRFMSGERGIPMKTLDVLADHLDLNIAIGTGRRKGK